MVSKINRIGINLAILALTLTPYSSQAAKPPTQVGRCSETFVARVGTRLVGETGQPIASSGTSISFTNGIYLVSYDTVSAVQASKLKDKVKMCLNSVPKNCPPGDNRGKVYKVMNYRTGGRFTMSDSQHSCGGA
ncbi:hypothetical protein [Phormidesmis priestleyi]|uniref:hypothetical protein n=1 Tax=Phormidesmis priestleyi TaxID=268141 RepID=UPI00083BA41C|nr:hypothetical protein [Phormidesmis priestleyi]